MSPRAGPDPSNRKERYAKNIIEPAARQDPVGYPPDVNLEATMLKFLRMITVPLWVTVVLTAAYLVFVFVSRHESTRRFSDPTAQREEAESNARFLSTYGGAEVKILQFYAREGTLVEGASTVICYGVVNAKSVTIEPKVDGVSPSLNRCVAVAPEKDTTYTMTAEGNNGKKVSASFLLSVKPDEASLPRVTSFMVAKHTVERGKHIYLLTFAFENAKEVSIDPPLFSPLTDSAPFGQFFAAPEKTTTYTLTVTGKRGRKASKQLTLTVPE